MAVARPAPAFAVFFPVASVFAAAVVPAWVLEYAGVLGSPAAGGMLRHGHEMVFGYALAVAGGYLLTRVSRHQLVVAVAAWLAGRAASWGLPLPGALAAAAGLAFPLVLLQLGGRQYLRAAKTMRNAVIGLVIGAFTLAEAVYFGGRLGVIAGGEALGLGLGVDLIILLLFVMGGRVIAAATSGAIQRRGDYLAGVAQPRLERLGVLALIAMAVGDAAALPVLSAVAGAVAGGVILVRLVRWRFWTVLGDAAVSLLHLGYAWLGGGLLLLSLAQAGLGMAPPDALHAVMIGGLGTLTMVMMARVTLQRTRRPIVIPASVIAAVVAVTVAAVARIWFGWGGTGLAAVVLAAAAWSGGFLAFTLFLIRRLLSTAQTQAE